MIQTISPCFKTSSKPYTKIHLILKAGICLCDSYCKYPFHNLQQTLRTSSILSIYIERERGRESMFYMVHKEHVLYGPQKTCSVRSMMNMFYMVDIEHVLCASTASCGKTSLVVTVLLLPCCCVCIYVTAKRLWHYGYSDKIFNI